MDFSAAPKKPSQLLDDLETIRELLGEEHYEPPLLTDSLDFDNIPLLSDIVAPAPLLAPASAPSSLSGELQQRIQMSHNLQQFNSELHAAAQLIMQEVIDDFVPRIEAELKQRLEARLPRLLKQSTS